MSYNILQNKSGFTLLEMMIAVSIFTVVMIITSNMFLQSIDSQMRAISSKSIQESLNFALTIMTNEMSGAVADPTGCGVECAGLSAEEFFCTVDNEKLIFRNASNNCISYSLDPALYRVAITRNPDIDANDDIYLTPSNIKISALSFSTSFLEDDITSDPSYPITKATVALKGESLAQDNYPDIVSAQATIMINNRE